MLITHELPAGWADTGESGVIQPSEVAGMAHVAELEAADIAATFLGAALVYGGVRISVLRSKNATVFAYEIGL